MKITKISLTNFKSFGRTQTIEFAPVTLLFGPNSVGKSTVLNALFYLQQILEKGQCDPMYLDAMNKKFVGGFEKLVHKRNLNSNITIRVDYEKTGIGSSYAYLYELLSEELDIQLSSPVVDAQNIAIELEIAWSNFEKTAYVKEYSVWFDGQRIAVITSDAGTKQASLSWLNYIHPLLLPANHEDWKKSQKDSNAALHPFNRLEIYGQDIYSDSDKSQFLKITDEKLLQLLKDKSIRDVVAKHFAESLDFGHLSEDLQQQIKDGSLNIEIGYTTEDCYVSALHELLNNRQEDIKDKISVFDVREYWLLHNPIGIESWIGALPHLGRKIRTSLDLEDIKQNEIISEFLSDILIAPLDNLLQLLKQSISIGPIRKIIDQSYQTLPYVEQGDWYDGSAAWSILDGAELNTLKKINEWMSQNERLALGYGLVLNCETSFGDSKSVQGIKDFNTFRRRFNQLISQGINDNNFEFDSKKETFSFSIWDNNNHIAVNPSEIGTGVSQLIPLIVAAVTKDVGIIACEQPELHLHPRVQVAIGDLLIENSKKVNFLIETHSEHLILRLLKRIRQTADNELPSNLRIFTKDEIAITYLEPSEEGVVAKCIRVNEDGEFKDKWPKGFFGERRDELM